MNCSQPGGLSDTHALPIGHSHDGLVEGTNDFAVGCTSAHRRCRDSGHLTTAATVVIIAVYVLIPRQYFFLTRAGIVRARDVGTGRELSRLLTCTRADASPFPAHWRFIPRSPGESCGGSRADSPHTSEQMRLALAKVPRALLLLQTAYSRSVLAA